MDGFEYAIKKDVRNNPVVREVDEARHRQQWRWAGIAAFLVTMVLFWAWQNFVILRNSYDAAGISDEIENEVKRGQNLRVDLEKLRKPARIQAYATEQLHLVQPTGHERIVIQRVRPADLPAHSVLARR
jgi:hypothetical protein